MLRLRKILLCNYLYYLILIVCLIITIYKINNPIKSNLKGVEKHINGIVTNISSEGDEVNLIIKIANNEKVRSTYYFKTLKEKKYVLNSINLGDNLKLYGVLNKPKSNKTKGLFDYKKYLKRNNIYYIQKVDSITINYKCKNIFYKIKEKVINRCKSPYSKVFILGDKSLIDKNILNNYRDLGISHLFAISGMHISLLSTILLKLLKKIKIKEEKRYLIVSIFLISYLLLTGFSPSILRAVLFFILFSINKVYYFYIKSTNIYILVLVISLIYNPNYIYDVAFLYSFSISLSLIIMGDYINSYNGYLKKLFITSLISFIVSIPISLYNFNCINILSIIYNLFYVPFISIVVFPFSILTFIFPFLNNIFNIFIIVLEKSSIFLNKICFSKLIFCSNNIYFYIVYILFIIIFLYGLKINKKKYLIFIIILLIVNYLQPIIFDKDYLMMIDVGQGDSILIHSKNKNILIDTGGVMSFIKEKWKTKKQNSIVENTTIPILKKKGIKKIDYLILTHGDYDHMGEAINLVNSFKVEKVIFNCGRYNYLEKELIKLLDKKNIKYYSCIDELNIDNNKLYFLQIRDFNNENDNSNVIYTEINKYKFLFMGDASVTTEKEILKEYDLPDIDVLKVGHHGSRTSSSKEFISTINPKYSLISVGKDNKFKHPNKETLENLKESKIYRTDKQGSIMFKIKNNKLKIETCNP